MFNLFKRFTAPRLPVAGRFEATVSGDVNQVLRGEAVFGVSRQRGKDGAEDYDLFCLFLEHESRKGDGEHTVTITNRLPDAPSAGRYSFGDMAPRSLVAIYNHVTEDGRSGAFVPKGGKLEITESSPVMLVGSFEYSARGFNTYKMVASEGSIRIFGTFSALRVEDAVGRALRSPQETAPSAEAGLSDRYPLMDAEDRADLEEFADSVIQNLVLTTFYPGLVDLFATAGYGAHDIDRVEAFLFTVFPLDHFTRLPHFEDRSDEMRAAFRSAVETQVATLANAHPAEAKRLVEARFAEYSDAVFDATGILVKDATGILVKDAGMMELSGVGFRSIVGGTTENYNLLVALFQHFNSISQLWQFGAKLKELHEHYEVAGDAIWDSGDNAD